VPLAFDHHVIMGGSMWNESASCGLDSDNGFIQCCGRCTLVHECLVVPVACSA
jgi:hypothetical protein